MSDKTKYFQLDYMLPNQANKEFIFNESINIIDDILYHSIHSFFESLSYEIQDDLEKIYNIVKHGNKVIIGDGVGYLTNSRIYYLPRGKSEMSYFTPRHGMVVYVQSHNQFYMYFSINNEEGYFDVIRNGQTEFVRDIDSEEYELNSIESASPYINLTLQRTATIKLDKIKHQEVTFFIRYNSSVDYNLYWPNNIIWHNNNVHKIILDENLISENQYKEEKKTNYIKPNRVDIVKIYRMCEPIKEANLRDYNYYFLGCISSQNYCIE